MKIYKMIVIIYIALFSLFSLIFCAENECLLTQSAPVNVKK